MKFFNLTSVGELITYMLGNDKFECLYELIKFCINQL